MKVRNVQFLVEGLVRQTATLVAELSTATSERPGLGHLPAALFEALGTELELRGLNRRVVADLFGLTVEGYRLRRQRIAAEHDEPRERPLAEAMVQFVAGRGLVTRVDLLQRAALGSDPRSARSVLRDLVSRGRLVESGRGTSAAYRVADAADDATPARDAEQLVRVALKGREPLSLAELRRRTGLDDDTLAPILAGLLRTGAVERHVDGDDGELRYRAFDCLIFEGEPAGWQAAVFDHFRALVTALRDKLLGGSGPVGGSTYVFELPEGHPLAAEVLDLLPRLRREVGDLWDRVEAWNREHPTDDRPQRDVTFYFGQTLTPDRRLPPRDTHPVEA